MEISIIYKVLFWKYFFRINSFTYAQSCRNQKLSLFREFYRTDFKIDSHYEMAQNDDNMIENSDYQIYVYLLNVKQGR